MSVNVLIAQQISGVAEPPRVQCCSLCSVPLHGTAQCIQHRVGQCSVNVDSHLTLCFVFMSVDPGHTLHLYERYSSTLQNISATFPCLWCLPNSLYCWNWCKAALFKKQILNQQYGVFGDSGAQGQAASYFVSKYHYNQCICKQLLEAKASLWFTPAGPCPSVSQLVK